VEGKSYVLFLQELLHDLNSVLSIPSQDGSPLFCENPNCVNITKDLTSISGTKHVEVAYLWIQEIVEEGRVTIKDIPTEEQPADIFTKNLSCERFVEYLKKTELLSAMAHSEEKS
jgi:histone deacetylase 1/2